MAIFNVNTFVKIPPAATDTAIFIYDGNDHIVMAIDPYVSTFYNKTKYVYIMSDGRMDINNVLEFSTESEASQAVDRLLEAKKCFTDRTQTTLETIYTKTQSDELYVHRHSGDTMDGSLTIYNDLTVTGNLILTGLTLNGIISASTYYGDGSNLSGLAGHYIHNDLQDIQGGTTNEEYHLNYSNYSEITGNTFANKLLYQSHTSDTSIHYIKGDILLDDLGNVNTGGTLNGYNLSYSGGTWIGVPNSADLSNYYNKQQVYNTGETYSKTEINNDFLSANTYIPNEANFLSANTSFYTQAQTNVNFLSGNSLTPYWTSAQTKDYVDLHSGTTVDLTAYWTSAQTIEYLTGITVDLSAYYTTAQTNANFLSGNSLTPYWTSAQTIEYLTGITVDLSAYYTSSQTNQNFVSGLTFQSHTANTNNPHNTTAAQISAYTITQSDNNFLSAATIFESGYTSAECDANFLSANTSFYTQAQANNNFVSGLTFYTHTGNTNNPHNTTAAQISAYTITQSNNNFLSANTSYYTQAQANTNFLSANTLTQYWNSAQTVSYVDSHSGSSSGGTTDLSAYWTSSQTISYVDSHSGSSSGGTVSGDYLSISGGTLTGNLTINPLSGTTDRMMKSNASGLTIAEDIIVDMTISLSEIDTTGITLYTETGWSNNTKTRDGYEGQRSYGLCELGCLVECICILLNTWKRSYYNPIITFTAITTQLSTDSNWSAGTYRASYGNVGMKYIDANYEYECVSDNMWQRYPTNASYIDSYITATGATILLQSGISWTGSIFTAVEPIGINTIYDGQWYKDSQYFYHRLNYTIYRQPILSVDTNKWTKVIDYCYTAVTSAITMYTDQTSYIKKGYALKYKLTGSSYFYGVCTNITSSLLTIAGAPLTTGNGDLHELYYSSWPGQTEMVAFVVSGNFATSAITTLLASNVLTKVKWDKQTAYLSKISTTVFTGDTGASQPIVNVDINGANSVCTSNSNSGLTVSQSWVDSTIDINTLNYDINYGESLEIRTSAGTNGNASDLTIQLTFVYQ